MGTDKTRRDPANGQAADDRRTRNTITITQKRERKRRDQTRDQTRRDQTRRNRRDEAGRNRRNRRNKSGTQGGSLLLLRNHLLQLHGGSSGGSCRTTRRGGGTARRGPNSAETMGQKPPGRRFASATACRTSSAVILVGATGVWQTGSWMRAPTSGCGSRTGG